MRVLTISNEGDDPLDTEPLLVARCGTSLVRGVLDLLSRDLTEEPPGPDARRRVGSPRGPREEVDELGPESAA
jgi:hypothetical protein